MLPRRPEAPPLCHGGCRSGWEVSRQSPGCDPPALLGPRRLQPLLDGRSLTGVLSSMRACLLAVHSRDSAGLGLAGTVKPCFLEYKSAAFPPPRQALAQHFLPRSPAPWPLPAPYHIPAKQHPIKAVVPRGVSRGSAPLNFSPKYPPSNPIQNSLHKREVVLNAGSRSLPKPRP